MLAQALLVSLATVASAVPITIEPRADGVLPKDLDVLDKDSIISVSKTLVKGVLSYYPGSDSTYKDLPKPYYWWESGALFGALVDYSRFTGDHSYDEMIATAILAQVGPDNDFILPKHRGDEGNGDQAFWALAAMAATEDKLPQSSEGAPSWEQLSINAWNNMASRWDTTTCHGGLRWQIFDSNPNGLDYKNTVSNGGFFQLSARLYAWTGNETYAAWATKVWNWTAGVGLIDTRYNVFDGTDSATGCSVINPLTFSYTAGLYLYGAAAMASATADSDSKVSASWASYASHLLEGGVATFFGPDNNENKDVMWEHACEGVNLCDTNMKAYKGLLSRFMYRSAEVLPSLRSSFRDRMRVTAKAAANTCQGGRDGTTCGQKWYVGGYDGSYGLGQSLSALETVQGLVSFF